jgi:hypothetical protein
MITVAFDMWGAVQSDRPYLVTGIAFERTTNPAQANIRIYWQPYEALGEWTPNTRQLIFASNVSWYFPLDPASTPANEYHFFSTAFHETGHVAGLGDQNDNDDVMIFERGPGPNGPCFSSIDPDSIEGIRDLYSIPAPDFGDAPDPMYPTKKASNGARNLFIGREWLGENAVQTTTTWEWDARAVDNDNGVRIEWFDGEPPKIRFTVVISTSAQPGRYVTGNPAKLMHLNAWVDWNNDGSWAQAGDYVIVDDTFDGPTVKQFPLNIPEGVDPQNIGWARFRLDYGENVASWVGAGKYGGEVEDYKIKGPPYAKAEPRKTIGILIPNEGRNYDAFTIIVYNPTDHALKVGMAGVAWVVATPEDTIIYVLDGFLDVPEGGISNPGVSDPVNLPGFSVGPIAQPGLFPCEITWSVSVTNSAYGTVNVAVGFKFTTDPSVILRKILCDFGGGMPPQFFAFDGKVDSKDLALFLRCYKGLAPPEAIYMADLGGGLPPQYFNFDGKVDGKDLALFLRCYRGEVP